MSDHEKLIADARRMAAFMQERALGTPLLVTQLADALEAIKADPYCRAENCQYRYWSSGSMPTHRRGDGCPEPASEQRASSLDELAQRDEEEWPVDYEAEPGIARNAFRRGQESLIAAGWRRPPSREQLRDTVAEFICDEYIQGQVSPADYEAADALLALLNCPCTEGAPEHIHGQGGYAS